MSKEFRKMIIVQIQMLTLDTKNVIQTFIVSMTNPSHKPIIHHQLTSRQSHNQNKIPKQ